MATESDRSSTKRIRLTYTMYTQINENPVDATTTVAETMQNRLVQNPLGMPEILQKILKLMDTNLLKSYRLVDHRWNENSCKILSERENLCIHLGKFDQIDEDSKDTSRSLMDLTIYLDGSPHKIPCQNFHMSTTDFDNDTVYEFLNSYGSKIRRLHLKCHQIIHYANQRLLGYLGILLTKQAPNIVFLELELSQHVRAFEYGDSKRYMSKLFDVRTTTELPNLKKFRVINVQILHIGNEIIKEILTAAINLEEFEALAAPFAGASWGSRWLTVDYINELIVSKKLYTVKTAAVAPALSLTEEEEESMGDEFRNADLGYTKKFRLQKFANHQPPPRLQTLFLHLDEVCGLHSSYKYVTEMVQKVLNVNVDSLKSVTLEPMEFLQNLTFPILKNVYQLHLSARSSRFDRTKLLPMDQKLVEVFPNLTHVILDSEHDYEAAQYYLQKEIPVPSVLQLTIRIQTYSCEPFLRTLAKMFPNLNRLVVDPSPGGRRDLPLVLKEICKNFSKLQGLCVKNFWMDCEDGEALQKQILQLDEAITGIPMAELKDRKIKSTSLDDSHRPSSSDSLVGRIPGLTFLRLELKLGLWSDFAKNGLALDYPIFWTGRQVFESIPSVLIDLIGDMDKDD